MPTHQTRYSGQLYSQNGKYYHFKIYDKNYTSSYQKIEIIKLDDIKKKISAVEIL